MLYLLSAYGLIDAWGQNPLNKIKPLQIPINTVSSFSAYILKISNLQNMALAWPHVMMHIYNYKCCTKNHLFKDRNFLYMLLMLEFTRSRTLILTNSSC